MVKKTYAVIGLGQLGSAVVNELINSGNQVIAIDKKEENIKAIKSIATNAVLADSTDEEELVKAGIKKANVAIVCFGHNKEASVLTVVNLRELGIEQIYARADDPFYEKALKRLGATEIITPQKTAALTLVNKLNNENYNNVFKLDDKYSVVSLKVNESLLPQRFKDLNAKGLYGINIILVIRGGKSFVPTETDALLANDILYLAGTTKEIKNFTDALNGVKKKK